MSGRPLSIGPQTGCHSSIHLSSTGGFSAPLRKGHYRPFSTLHTQSSCTLPNVSRSASPSGLHQFRNSMGFHFGSKGRKLSVRANSSAGLPPISDGPSLRPTKKRSMTSIVAASDALSPSPSSSPGCSDALPVIDISKQVSYEEDELDPCDDFVPKNIWAERCNMRLHPYHKQVVYMQAYDPISLESDRYTELLFQRLSNGSPSFHDYQNKPPTMVLDLGCGQGHWILHAASIWRDTEFVGLDIVDITLPTFQTLHNVRLVRGDFLKYKLPFPDNTFDLVRMANLALCIPYDQWELVLRQVHRVLMPGGRLELIDDDIYFPYGEESKEFETFVPSQDSKVFWRDDPLEDGNEMKHDDTDDTDSILMNPSVPNISEVACSSPTTFDLPASKVCLVRSRARYALGRRPPLQSPAYVRGLTSVPMHPTPQRVDLGAASSPTSAHLRQYSGSKTMRKSVTAKKDSPSSTTKNWGNPANLHPCPKRTREKAAPLPSIRSITPTFSSGAGYSPTWSLRTVDTSTTSSDTSSIGTTDTSPTASIRSVINKPEWKASAWRRKVSASKNMETLFEKMLIEQYGIHRRPADFLLQVLRTVFDEGNAEEPQARMKKSFHIKLASTPTDSRSYVGRKEKGRHSMDETNGASPTSTRTGSSFKTTEPEKQNVTSTRSGTGQRGQSKESKSSWPRSTKEKEKQLKQEERRSQQARLKRTQAASLFKKKSRLQDPSLSTPVRPTLSAKAAVILGIPYSELSAVTSTSLSSSKLVRPLPCPHSNLSTKAAGRLGIPYSEALSAAASLSVPHVTESFPTTNSESTSSPGPVQHTGLLIWPNSYVPMTVGELEMHACKYIHTLLGCRPALEEFIAKFVDERGNKFVEEEEFKDEIWEYECFRRGRFGWPSEVAEPDEDDPTSPNASEPSSPLHNSTGTGTGTGRSVDANHPTAHAFDPPDTFTAVSINKSPHIVATTVAIHQPHQPGRTNNFGGFSTEKSLRPTRSSLCLQSSIDQQYPSIPMKVKSQTMPLARSALPPPFSHLVPSYSRIDNSDESMTEGAKLLHDLIHMRSIRVFEGVKAA